MLLTQKTTDMESLQYRVDAAISFQKVEATWYPQPSQLKAPIFRYVLGATTTARIDTGSLKDVQCYHQARQGTVVSAFLLAERSLAGDWLRPEEDEAWAHLQ